MSPTIVIAAVVLVVAVVLALVFGRRQRHISLRRFAFLPVIAIVGVLWVAPEVGVSPLADALLPVGAVLGVGLGWLRGGPRFTQVGGDDQGRLVYKENPVGVLVIIAVLVVHQAVDLAGEIGPALSALVMLALGVGAGEAAGFHLRVYRRFRALGGPGRPDGPAPEGSA